MLMQLVRSQKRHSHEQEEGKTRNVEVSLCPELLHVAAQLLIVLQLAISISELVHFT